MSHGNNDHSEADEIRRVVELIHLGARLQLLESESTLSRERLVVLYEEATGAPPSAAMPPLPADWFLVWKPNIHASLFIAIWRYMKVFLGLQGLDAIVQAYRLYQGHMQATCVDPILSVTRAWTLTRYFGVLLDTVPCSACGHAFVVATHEIKTISVCGLCRAPAEAHAARSGYCEAHHDALGDTDARGGSEDELA